MVVISERENNNWEVFYRDGMAMCEGDLKGKTVL